ncbi:MAG: GAF domain-containing protein [Desulfobacterales bacterium]|nr:GAF domain-containing protein [Desulfobacterales bacterium]
MNTSSRYHITTAQADLTSETPYRALIDFIPDPVFLLDTDSTVSYVNPAFVSVFKWTSYELEGKRIPFIPDHLKSETRDATRRLYQEGELHGVESQRLTKDGRLIDVILEGAIFYDEYNKPAGQILTLRDISQRKRSARTNQALFRIASSLHRFRELDVLLEFISGEVRELIGVDGASVILLDENRNEFFFRIASLGDSKSRQKMKEVRFPAERGIAGRALKSGKPVIVPDTSKDPDFFRQVDDESDYITRSMLDVPIRIKDQIIGVLCAQNKKKGMFDQNDVELLSTIAGTVAFSIENARVNEALSRSYEEVKSLNRAKDRVIHQLSHELKTPLAVLSASQTLLEKKLKEYGDKGLNKILERSKRNLNRMLKLQYEIEDIQRDEDYKAHQTLSFMLESCADEIEALAVENIESPDPVNVIRKRIDEIFGPGDDAAEKINLDQFVKKKFDEIRSEFQHRRIEIIKHLSPASPVFMPISILAKIFTGLLRNAVENTPDNGRIEIIVRPGVEGPVMIVKDYGVGIIEENQQLIFESNLTTRDTSQYASKKPYDFNAGGKGFDLLRMKIFSERHHFKIDLKSERCRFIPRDEDLCPGNIKACRFCNIETDCYNSGETTITLRFPRHLHKAPKNSEGQ